MAGRATLISRLMRLSRERPPRRSLSRDEPHSTSVLDTPHRKQEPSLSAIKEILRWLVDKVHELEGYMSFEQTKRKIITIKEKTIEKSPRVVDPRIQTSFINLSDSNTKIESLLESLEEKKSSELRLAVSPINQLGFDPVDVKEIVEKELVVIKVEMDDLKDKFKAMEQKMESGFSDFEEELTSLIISMKDAVYGSKLK